ncbi:MAG: HPP family protein, partial [Chitinophagales bacterium]
PISPLVFGKRLWHESRMILYQQASDTSISSEYLRAQRPRVIFGDDWIKDGVLDIYKEDVGRFRVLLGGEIDEDSLEVLKRGEIPLLKALQIHNSSVYRWNRPCYGISPNGKPHLRIENRMLPAGPTVVDEIANAALWWGLMIGLMDEVSDIRERISFAEVKDNFGKAAKYGIHSELTWLNGKKMGASELLIKELIPLARKGLESRRVDHEDIDFYLGIIEARAKKKTSGASWMLSAYNNLLNKASQEEALAILTSNIIHNQWEEKPVHTWELPQVEGLKPYLPIGLKAEELMETSLLTVHKKDLVELAIEVMKWEKLPFMAVEDEKGNYLGLVADFNLPKLQGLNNAISVGETIVVEDIMLFDTEVIHPSMGFLELAERLRNSAIACLPVVKNGKLLGMITEKTLRTYLDNMS